MKDNYYSSGEFAKKAGITLRTVRYYDKMDILKPSYVSEAGSRFYTDSDFTHLSQVLLLKYLGFSLDDIKALTLGDSDKNNLKHSLVYQKKLLLDKISNMKLMLEAIDDIVDELEREGDADWNRMVEFIGLINTEQSVSNQYRNAANVNTRISLHKKYSVNKEGWFNWIFDYLLGEVKDCKRRSRILELGCGDGSIWMDNMSRIPAGMTVYLTDISAGMLSDAKRNLNNSANFKFRQCDMKSLPFKDESFNLLMVNHSLFYSDDIDATLSEIKRVLVKGGSLIVSSYGENHMKEISSLVHEFDKNIKLSFDCLYERFGLDNGEEILRKYFTDIRRELYDDYLLVDNSEPLIEYILSCHGNQNEHLLNRYSAFKRFMEGKKWPMRITKEAGIFIARKEEEDTEE